MLTHIFADVWMEAHAPSSLTSSTTHASVRTTTAAPSARYSTCARNDRVKTTACAHSSHLSTTSANAKTAISAPTANDRIRARTRRPNAPTVPSVRLISKIWATTIVHARAISWANIATSASRSSRANIAIVVSRASQDRIVIFWSIDACLRRVLTEFVSWMARAISAFALKVQKKRSESDLSIRNSFFNF